MNPVQGSEWWEGTSLRTGKQGEIPSSYLIKRDEHPDQMRCVCCTIIYIYVYNICCISFAHAERRSE